MPLPGEDAVTRALSPLCRAAVVGPGQLQLVSITATNSALLGEVVTRLLSVWEGAWLFIPLFKSGEVATRLLMGLSTFPDGGI